MNAALYAVAGPLAGRAFALSADEVPIGRASSNLILLPLASVSRHHCVIEEVEGQIQIRDLASHNGTFVNGVPVKLSPLYEGDRLDIGEVSLVFSTGGGSAHRGVPFTRTSSAFSEMSTGGGLPPALARETAVLFKISALAHFAHELYLSQDSASKPHLEKLLLQLIRDLLPFTQACLVLVHSGGGGRRPERLASFVEENTPGGGGGEDVELNQTLIDDVLKTASPVISGDAQMFWLAAPLLANDGIIGVLYVGRNLPQTFSENDGQTFTALTEIIAHELQRARDLDMLLTENRMLKSEVNLDRNMVGESEAIERIYRAIAKVAPGNSTVLIRGESGTGKELVARAIHRNSTRSAKPFVAINCAAVTETLLESELFGHEKGAFTGAFAQRKGKLEAADGGTLFLDEVGELAPALQAKLLRVLQEREFERVGGNRSIAVDVRVLAATNRDLEEAIHARTFRQDLYYRLNVIAITVPALRDRKDDIPLLATWFAQKVGAEVGRQVTGISRQARAILLAYEWPGNIRELRNAIEHAVVLGSTPLIMPDDLPEELRDVPPPQALEPGGFHDTVREAKKRIILEAIDQAKGNVSEAARALRLHPNYLHRLVTTLHLRDQLPGS